MSRKWLAEAKHPRWDRLYTELVYQPMIEVLNYLRSNGYRTFIATGDSGGFVREYAEKVYGIVPEQSPTPSRRSCTATTRTFGLS